MANVFKFPFFRNLIHIRKMSSFYRNCFRSCQNTNYLFIKLASSNNQKAEKFPSSVNKAHLPERRREGRESEKKRKVWVCTLTWACVCVRETETETEVHFVESATEGRVGHSNDCQWFRMWFVNLTTSYVVGKLLILLLMKRKICPHQNHYEEMVLLKDISIQFSVAGSTAKVCCHFSY